MGEGGCLAAAAAVSACAPSRSLLVGVFCFVCGSARSGVRSSGGWGWALRVAVREYLSLPVTHRLEREEATMKRAHRSRARLKPPDGLLPLGRPRRLAAPPAAKRLPLSVRPLREGPALRDDVRSEGCGKGGSETQLSVADCVAPLEREAGGAPALRALAPTRLPLARGSWRRADQVARQPEERRAATHLCWATSRSRLGRS